MLNRMMSISFLLFLYESVYFGTSADLSEIEIFREYCPGVKTCTERDSDTHIDVSGPTCCLICTCDEHCWARGNCCPDAPHPYEPITVQCIPKKSYFDYFIVDRCVDGQTSIHSMICESDNDPKLLDEAVLVSDINNSRVFRNRFCAECNGVKNYVPWKIAALHEFSNDQCTNGENTLLSNISKLEDCEFISVRPNEEIHNNAICQRNNILMTTDCPPSDNETLQWYHERCEKYRLPAFFNNLVNNDSRIYRNVYCFICLALREGKDPGVYKTCESGIVGQLGGTRYRAILTFKQIFGLTADEGNSEPSVCDGDQMFDEYKKRCLEYSCGFGFVNQDGKCVRNILESYHAQFRIQFEFTQVTTRHNISSSVARIYIKAAKELITSIHHCPFANEKAWVNNDAHKGNFFWEVDIFTTINCQDQAMKDIVEYMKNNEVAVTDETFSNSTVFFIKPAFLNIPIDKPRKNLTIDLNKVRFTSPIFEINAVTFCTAILLSETMLNDFQEDISINLAQSDTLLDSLRNNIIFENGVYKLCYDTYDEIRRELKSSIKHLSASVTGYLSLSCTVVSVICTGLTVAVNIIFDRSNKLPKYILHLVCINLILAQSMFQFGIGAEISGFPCVLIGVLIHYLWLSHAFAMSSFVFGVVLTLRKGLTSSDLSCFIISAHLLYIYGVPLIFVLLNILVSKITTEENAIGYGEGPERLCYISTVFSRTVFFVVPLFVIVGLNMGSYIYFVWFMIKQRIDSEVLQSQRLYIQAYARLSCVTGITWVFGLMSEYTDVDIFEYLFILTNCGQGIFLFLAFGKIRTVCESIKTRTIVSKYSTEK